MERLLTIGPSGEEVVTDIDINHNFIIQSNFGTSGIHIFSWPEYMVQEKINSEYCVALWLKKGTKIRNNENNIPLSVPY